ncbi:hypothetical protein A4A49_60139 [Nicotiana attenuata]|uniref:Uncharacterized protein n=1 Tax=Nicotiana attenuata TaxID=49451 RepID=A0A1J6I706_NICAT|nr:hypothetical protein A4A49_60139 [Nicotiana attenuata]
MNIEVDIVNAEGNIDDRMEKWIVEKLKFSVKQPIEAVVTKAELQYLAFLSKSEVDSMSRVAAGILRVLKLEGSIGPGAIRQLSNLEVKASIEYLPLKNSAGSSSSSIGLRPSSNLTGGSRNSCIESTLASVVELIKESQSKCAALSVELGSSTSSQMTCSNP